MRICSHKMAGSCPWKIRLATREDVSSIVWLTQVLAEFQNAPRKMKIGEREMLRDGFGDKPLFHVLVVEWTADDGPTVDTTVDPTKPSTSMPHNERIVGHALFFYSYCTWEGKCLFLEDLCVREEYRSRGIGTALMQACAKVACEEGCVRMIWQVLDWNTRAAELYERIGGKILKEWLTIRMTQPELGKCASAETLPDKSA